MNKAFVHHRIVSAVKTIQFDNFRISYVVLRVHWRNIVILNVYAARVEKSDD